MENYALCNYVAEEISYGRVGFAEKNWFGIGDNKGSSSDNSALRIIYLAEMAVRVLPVEGPCTVMAIQEDGYLSMDQEMSWNMDVGMRSCELEYQ